MVTKYKPCIVQYNELNNWAFDNMVEFQVCWYPDCHWLFVTEHHGDGMCHGAVFEYSHKGGCREITRLGNYGKVAEFKTMFDEMHKHAPIQPTAPLGYVALGR